MVMQTTLLRVSYLVIRTSVGFLYYREMHAKVEDKILWMYAFVSDCAL